MWKTRTVGDCEVAILSLEEDLAAEKEILEDGEVELQEAENMIHYAKKEITRIEALLVEIKDKLAQL